MRNIHMLLRSFICMRPSWILSIVIFGTIKNSGKRRSTCPSNLVKISHTAAKLLQFLFFQYGGRPPSWFVISRFQHIRPPMRCLLWKKVPNNFLCLSGLRFWRHRICHNTYFNNLTWNAHSRPKFRILGVFDLWFLNIIIYHRVPQKALSCQKPLNTSHCLLESVE